MILKNTTIGDNVIIGARSVVKGVVPSNTVWAGCPARQICTIEEFYRKKCERRIKDALYRRDHIRESLHRNPTIKEMGLFSCLFLERTPENYSQYISNVEFNERTNVEGLFNYFFKSTPLFKSFDEFLKL